MEAFLLISTAGSKKEAGKIAKIVVEKGLAACVNVLPAIDSHYAWKGKIERSREVLMIMKSTGRQIRKLAREIKELHSYDVPEILWFRVAGGEEKYLGWLAASTSQFHGNKGKKVLT